MFTPQRIRRLQPGEPLPAAVLPADGVMAWGATYDYHLRWWPSAVPLPDGRLLTRAKVEDTTSDYGYRYALVVVGPDSGRTDVVKNTCSWDGVRDAALVRTGDEVWAVDETERYGNTRPGVGARLWQLDLRW